MQSVSQELLSTNIASKLAALMMVLLVIIMMMTMMALGPKMKTNLQITLNESRDTSAYHL